MKIYEASKTTKHDAGGQALLRHDQLGSSRASSPSSMCLPKDDDERIMSNKSEEETRQQTVEHSNTLNNVHQGDTRCEVSFSDDSCTESETHSVQDHCKNDSHSEHKQISEDKTNLCCNDVESLKCEVTKSSTKRFREPSDWIGVDEQSVTSFNGSFESFLVNDNDEDITNSERSASVMSKMRYLTAIASLGGFLSGYNTGVISGAMLPVQRRFDLTREQEELVVTCAILSAFFSSLLGGTLNQSFGRKRTILGAAAVFVLGAFILLSAQNLFMLVCGEIALGLAIGLESLTSPMYIAEMAKPSIRGRLVSMYALLMCFGQVFAGIIDGSFSKMDGGWRYMFGFAAFPGTLMFVGFLSLPESPAYLASKGSHVEATRVLSMLRDSDRDVEHEMEEIKLSLRMSGSTFASSCDCNDYNDDNQVNDTTKLEHDGNHKKNYSTMEHHCTNGSMIADDDLGAPSSKSTTMEHVTEMFRHTPTRRALTVGCGLMMLQQICGPNAVLYYAASIYEMAQFDETTSIWLSAFTAAAQIVGLIVSVYLVESVGRRLLALSSLTLVALSSLGLGFSFYLARTSSEPVLLHESDLACQQQVARVWNGITSYCYDCVQIPGCGYCGGSCLQGTIFGPNDTDACPLEETSSLSSPWTYSTCTNPDGWMSVLFMVLFLLFFGVGMGGLPWTYNSEIYPVKYRSLAVGISTATNWIGNLLVSSTFLTLSSPAILTSYGSFYLYSTLSFMGFIWLYFVMPETKGLTLEEIQAKFALDSDDSNKTTKQPRHDHQYSSDDCSNSIANTSTLPLHYQSNQSLHKEVSIPRTQSSTEECCRSSRTKRRNQASPPTTNVQHIDDIPGAVTSDMKRKALLTTMCPPTSENNINHGDESEEEEAAKNHHNYYGSFSQPPSRYGSSTTKNDPSSISRYTKPEQHHLNCAPMLAVDDDNPKVLLPPRHKCVLAGIAA